MDFSSSFPVSFFPFLPPFLVNFFHDLIWEFEKALEPGPRTWGEIQKDLLFLPCLFARQSFLPGISECGSLWELRFPETELSAGIQSGNAFLVSFAMETAPSPRTWERLPNSASVWPVSRLQHPCSHLLASEPCSSRGPWLHSDCSFLTREASARTAAMTGMWGH